MVEGSFQFGEGEIEELAWGKRSFRIEGQEIRRVFKMDKMRFY